MTPIAEPVATGRRNAACSESPSDSIDLVQVKSKHAAPVPSRKQLMPLEATNSRDAAIEELGDCRPAQHGRQHSRPPTGMSPLSLRACHVSEVARIAHRALRRALTATTY